MGLSESEKKQFIEDGYIVVESAFDVDHPTIAKWIEDNWGRCGLDPCAPESWPGKVHLPGDDKLLFKEIAPVAYEKVIALLGGEERMGYDLYLHNGFVNNFAMGRDEPWKDLKASGGWHVDGDFFRHFLDSKEQSCLIGSYFTDIEHQGGATLISPGSHLHVARFLAKHPEGVRPDFVAENNILDLCDRFIELTAHAGDVVIMHPFMMHSSSQNKSNKARLMNNNNTDLKENMNLNREDGGYSMVEKSILHALGVDHFDFQITHPREAIVPLRVKKQKEYADKLALVRVEK